MPLINCEINLILTWSLTCVTTNFTDAGGAFTITDTKLYVAVVTLSTQVNVKLLQQLKSGFKRIINWNKDQSKVSTDDYKMIAIDLGKEQALDADPRAIQQISFTGNFNCVGNTTMF